VWAALAGIAAGSAVAWLLRPAAIHVSTKKKASHVRLRVLNGTRPAAHTAAQTT